MTQNQDDPYPGFTYFDGRKMDRQLDTVNWVGMSQSTLNVMIAYNKSICLTCKDRLRFELWDSLHKLGYKYDQLQ